MTNGSGWGGKREGAGRKPDGYVPPQEKLDLDRIRAEHEQVKKDQREFKLAVERGEYVSRVAVQQASATIMALLAQSLRSIPDNCERQAGLSPDAVELIQQQVDAALTEAATALRALAGPATPS